MAEPVWHSDGSGAEAYGAPNQTQAPGRRRPARPSCRPEETGSGRCWHGGYDRSAPGDGMERAKQGDASDWDRNSSRSVFDRVITAADSAWLEWSSWGDGDRTGLSSLPPRRSGETLQWQVGADQCRILAGGPWKHTPGSCCSNLAWSMVLPTSTNWFCAHAGAVAVVRSKNAYRQVEQHGAAHFS